jgi:hypothetical protein
MTRPREFIGHEAGLSLGPFCGRCAERGKATALDPIRDRFDARIVKGAVKPIKTLIFVRSNLDP